MILRKNISLNEDYLKKLDPLMQKHNGNLSAVIREVIDLADVAFQDPDSVKKLISGLKKEQNLTSSTLVWALKNLGGRLPDEETVHNIIGNDISSLSDVERRLNELGNEVYWGMSIKINPDNNIQPKSATFSIDGKNPDANRYLAAVIALFVAKKFGLGISEIRCINGSLEMNLIKGENSWIHNKILENFGRMDAVFSELHKKPDFWNVLIHLYAKMNYDMSVIPRQLFEEIQGAGMTYKITNCIERFCGCPINQIPPEDFLENLKVLYKTMGFIEDIDINNESIIIHHRFSNPDAIGKLANNFIELLHLNGRTYSSTAGENLIVLKQLPEIGKILIRMVEDIKTREEPVADYYTDLFNILKMLKNVPSNDEFIRSLGTRFGTKIIETYKYKKNISEWDAGTFIKYLQDMNDILKQESKWSNVSENIICGKIMNCPLVKMDAQINSNNCMFIKSLYDIWISNAFGEHIERVHNMSQPSGNESCEIYIALKS
ncbi:MAG: hypothetical protein PHH85_06910 [Candidatus Methanoperedens sp.]|nr:hypothetical protein [Candidatus Methanoperedens sp.]